MIASNRESFSFFNKAENPAETFAPMQSVTFEAFGQEICLDVCADANETQRRLTELKDIYERALASRVLDQQGLAIDVGAGEGWFGIAFAKAFPKWQIVCLEADPATFRRLSKNVDAAGVENIVCVQAGVHPLVSCELPTDPDALRYATRPHRFVPVPGLPPRYAPDIGLAFEGPSVELPSLPPAALSSLAPDVIKLDAPYAEQEIGHALKKCNLHLLIGRLYSYVETRAFSPAFGSREMYLDYFGHVLRRDFEDGFAERRPGLDIVVAMYNTREFIEECVKSLLADENDDIRVLVVDDGSTDGSGDWVETLFADNPRVQVLRKANGGCASARNYGRQMSDASHIAFLDADDRVDKGMFSALLETARFTGAYVTEGEFVFLDTDQNGRETLRPSYEASIYADSGDQVLGPYSFSWIEGRSICLGQPTIWRRVHRRDFLDRKNIWFPEHVRAFDDQIFQFLVGQYCGTLAHVSGFNYHYRQHPGQDIKQGDERHFYSFNMFRSMIIRSLDEGWPDFHPLIISLLNTMTWSYAGLREDLKDTYLEAAARFLAVVSKTYGYTFTEDDLGRTQIIGLSMMLRRHLEEMRDQPVNYGLIQCDDWRWQPEFIRMAQSLPIKGTAPHTS